MTATPATPATPISPRRELRAAADAFVALVHQVPDAAWEHPGLGVWTVRELVGHTARALSTVSDYLAQASTAAAAAGAPAAEPVDPVTYFRIGNRAGLTNSGAVAERGGAAGRDLGTQPVETVEAMVRQVLGLVEATADDVVLTSRLAAIRLIDYLPTRTFELVVHGLDLQNALGLQPSAPPGALASSLAIATELALGQGTGPALLLALTGRAPLPPGTCVL